MFIHFVAIHFFAAENRLNITKTHIFEVQRHSRSSILIALKSMSPVLVMTGGMSVPICKRFHGRQTNSEK